MAGGAEVRVRCPGCQREARIVGARNDRRGGGVLPVLRADVLGPEMQRCGVCWGPLTGGRDGGLGR